VLGILIEFLRDLAVLAAASGLAWWTWNAYRTRNSRNDETARLQIGAERRNTDLMLLAQRLEQQIASASLSLDEITASAKAIEARWDEKARVHALLQSTDDPFLSFAEIEEMLSAPSSSGPDQGASDAPPLSGIRLRRILMELVGAGVIAQLDKDRYFIASDFEAADPADSGEAVSEPG